MIPSKSVFFMTRFGNAEPIPRTTDLIISYFLSLHATGAANIVRAVENSGPTHNRQKLLHRFGAEGYPAIRKSFKCTSWMALRNSSLRSLVTFTRNMRMTVVEMRQIGLDLFQKAISHHVIADFHRRTEAFGIRAAMTFDDNSAQAKENPAIDLVRVHFLTQAVERALSENIANLGKQRAAHGLAQQLRHLAGRTFRGLERDIAGETFGHNHIHRTFADVVAFNETGIGKSFKRRIAQNLACLLDLVEALDLFRADIEKPDGRLAHLEQGTRHTGAHDGVVDKLARIGADGSANVEHDAFTT